MVDGAGMLTTGNSSQGNLTIEMSDFQLLWVQGCSGAMEVLEYRYDIPKEVKQRTSVHPENCTGVGFKTYVLLDE